MMANQIPYDGFSDRFHRFEVRSGSIKTDLTRSYEYYKDTSTNHVSKISIFHYSTLS